MNQLCSLLVCTLLIFTNCGSPVTPIKLGNYDFFISGDISNQGCDVSIFDIRLEQYKTVENVQMSIKIAGESHSVPFDGLSYKLSKWLKPGSGYNLEVLLNGEFLNYSGVIPDSVSQAVLNLNKKSAYDYSISFRIDKAQPNENFVYYVKNELLSLTNSWQSDFIKDETSFSNITHSNFKIPNFCTNPLVPSKYKSLEILRTHKKYIDFLKYKETSKINQGNPLFLNYQSPSDVLIGKSYFRIFEFTNIKTNEIGINDSSATLLNIYIYDKAGIPLDAESQRKVKISLVSEALQSSIPDIPLNEKNPTKISLGKLSLLVNSNCEKITEINRLQNTFLDIYAYTSLTSAYEKVLISRLDSTIQITLKIKP